MFEIEITIKHLKVSKKIFEFISSQWGLENIEAIKLLGFISISEYENFYTNLDEHEESQICTNIDWLEKAKKVSYLMRIYRLIITIGIEDSGAKLIKRSIPKLGNKSPYELFIKDGIEGYDKFKKFLESLVGPW